MSGQTDGGDDCAIRIANDAWSPRLVTIFPIFGVIFAFGLAMQHTSVIFFIPVGFTILFLIFVSYICLFCANLYRSYIRSALSAFLGLVLGGLATWNSPNVARSIIRWEDDRQFARQRPTFDELVRQERARTSGKDAVKIVVHSEDRTLIAISNSFYHVIYDETDQAAHDPASVRGYWRCPTSETGLLNVGNPTEIEHVDGHYYRYWSTS